MDGIVFGVIVLIAIVIMVARSANTAQTPKKSPYQYRAKTHFMTSREESFFRVLTEIVADKYYVFPQVHLSGIIDHKITGQNWKYAFRHINGKSVDYVLCDKSTLKPVYAVELDDHTHKYKDRAERDAEVERIFEQAGLPLVRFTDYTSLSRDDIIARFAAARSKTEQN